MNIAEENQAAKLLYHSDEPEWFETLDSLIGSVHSVDQDAVRVWYSFWPLKVTQSLRESTDPVKTAQELLLYGDFQLGRVLHDSVGFLFGARWWKEICQAVLDFADRWEAGSVEVESLSDAIRAVAQRVSSEQNTPEELLLGITAVAFFALRHLGREEFANCLKNTEIGVFSPRSPEQLLALRRKRTNKSLFDFLYTVNRRHTVTWDEKEDRTFPAINNQYLAMAAALDQEDYVDTDSRRVEGPVPVQCRNGACGFCWVGLLGGKKNLSEITDFERTRLETFGYSGSGQLSEQHPHLRLACQARVLGDISIVIPPWNGFLNGR